MSESLAKRSSGAMRIIALVCVLVLSVVLGACSSGSQSAPENSSDAQKSQQANAEKVELHLQAAASLKYAFDEIIPLWEQKNPQVKVVGNFDASGTLAEQIKQGAPADLFISANKSKMKEVLDDGKVKDDKAKDFLENELVLIVPSQSKLALSSLEDLTKAEVKHVAVGDPSAVPAGKYAQQSFESAGIADKIEPKAVRGKDVTQVLTTVVSGNADAGLVYKTDALTQPEAVKIVATVEGHDKVVYPAAELKDTKHPREVHAFMEFISGPEVSKIFEKYGFKPLS